MSVFKSSNRKIFLKKRDIKNLIDAARDLNSIVEGLQSRPWVDREEMGVRLKDTKEWCRFFVTYHKVISFLLLLVLVGCRATPIVPAPEVKSMIPPMASTKSLEPKLIKFIWKHPRPEAVEFYKLYYGPAPRTYTNFVVSYTTNTTFIADRNVLHYFTVTANANGGALESDWSNEVGYPDWMVPRTNVVIVTMWSTNGTDWTDLRRETNAVNGVMGLWKLRIE